MKTEQNSPAVAGPVERPVRPVRSQTLTAPIMGGGPRDRFPYRRGMSAGANATGYNNPYSPGIDHDDYIHGYLDAVELADAIEENKLGAPNAELTRARDEL